jgi:hypothetical protein
MTTNSEPARRLVMLDIETNGLDPERHVAVEIAWHDMSTGEHGCFVPVHSVRETLASADIEALRVCRYIDRLATAEQDRSRHADSPGPQTHALWELLHGATVCGKNVAGFDLRFVEKLFRQYDLTGDAPTPWRHRTLEIGSYACGVLSLDPAEPPSMAALCEMLDVPPGDHTASGDVAAQVKVMEILRTMADKGPVASDERLINMLTAWRSSLHHNGPSENFLAVYDALRSAYASTTELVEWDNGTRS